MCGSTPCRNKFMKREPARARHQILTVIRLRLDSLRVRAIEHAFGLIDKPFVTANKKPAGAAGRVGNGEFRFATRIGFHHAHDRFNQHARSKVLARAFLSFARRFFQQTFERRAFNIDIHRRPILFVDHRDDALEIDRIVKARRACAKISPNNPPASRSRRRMSA